MIKLSNKSIFLSASHRAIRVHYLPHVNVKQTNQQVRTTCFTSLANVSSANRLNDVTSWKKEKGSDDVDQDTPMDLTTSSSSELKQESDSIKSFSKTNDNPSLPDSSCDVINIRDSRTPESSGTSAETIQFSTGRIFSQTDLSQTEESELLDHPAKIPRGKSDLITFEVLIEV